MILGASLFQVLAIEQALKMGLRVVAVDMNPDSVGFRIPGVISECISTIDIPAVVAAAKQYRIDGILTLASDMPMRTIATISKALGLPGITHDAALKATNKVFMRQALKEHHVPIPLFFKASTKEEYDEVIRQFQVPFIVKPADNAGSRGIFQITDISNRKSIQEAYEYSKRYSRNGDVVVEEYMRGPEVSVETLTVNGECHVIQVTDKITTGAPHFVEMGHTQPTRLSDVVVREIVRVAKMANKAIGITIGPSHTEIIVTDEGPKIVELGARLGGDCITSHLVPLSTGINMVECCIKIALGENPDINPKFQRGSAIRYFEQIEGEVKEISGLEEVGILPFVKQIGIMHGVGEKVTEIDSSLARMGFVIVQGENANDAERKAQLAMNEIKVIIK